MVTGGKGNCRGTALRPMASNIVLRWRRYTQNCVCERDLTDLEEVVERSRERLIGQFTRVDERFHDQNG